MCVCVCVCVWADLEFPAELSDVFEHVLGGALHGLGLQGEEGSCLPLLPVGAPLLASLPHLLQGLQVLAEEEIQKDMD